MFISSELSVFQIRQTFSDGASPSSHLVSHNHLAKRCSTHCGRASGCHRPMGTAEKTAKVSKKASLKLKSAFNYLLSASHVFVWLELSSWWMVVGEHDNVRLHESDSRQGAEQERQLPHVGGLHVAWVWNLWAWAWDRLDQVLELARFGGGEEARCHHVALGGETLLE